MFGSKKTDENYSEEIMKRNRYHSLKKILRTLRSILTIHRPDRLCLFMIFIVLVPTPRLLAQCNQSLVDRAATMAGNDAIFIRDFKVKLSEGSMENPSPVGKFPVFLNEGVHYRFTLASDTTRPGFGIMQLQRKDNTLGTTFDFEEHRNRESFDFHCTTSATYQVLISFNEGNPGCAAGALSMILKDSMNYIEPGQPLTSDSAATLYLFVENQLQIAATGIPRGHLEVDITNGTITQQGSVYIARPETPGTAVIHVAAFREDGSLNERDSILYQVDYPPLPDLKFPGQQGHVIYKHRLTGINQITMVSYVAGSDEIYELIRFSLSDQPNGMLSFSNSSLYLTQQQINLIRETPAGEKMYLTNIQFRDPEGKIHYGSIKEIWVDE